MAAHLLLFAIMPPTMFTENFQSYANSWAYHPEANEIVEAKVKALKLLLRSLVRTEFNQWDNFLPFALFAFNTSYNNQTGFTPYFINHGFEANFPGQTMMSF